jgi:hypothetical protein
VNDDEDQQYPPSAEGRNQNFGAGMMGGQIDPSPSLQETARRFNAQIPTSYRPSGTSNGMSADQFQATLGGMFPTQNGSATDTYQTKKYYGSQS